MDLRDGMETMSLTGELAATPLPGVDPTRVEYLHVLPNLLVSAHPDYVMTHRLVPLSPGRTWIECSWLVVPEPDGTAPDVPGAVDFWDLTNKQDWACLRVGAAWTRQPALPAGPVRAQRGRRRGAGGHDQPGLPPGTVPAMSGWIHRL